MFLSGNNRFLYTSLGKTLNGKQIRTFVMYEVDLSTGKLTFRKNFEQNSEFQNEFVSHFSVSPKGNLMFFGTNDNNSIKVYRIDSQSGKPVYLNTFDTDYVQHFTVFHVTEDQRHIYVGGGNSFKEIVAYTLNEQTGAISQIQEIESMGRWTSSWDLLVSADGQHLYKVDGKDDQKVLQFKRNPQTGILQFQKSYDNFTAGGKPINMHFFFADRNTDFLYGLHSFGDGDAIHVMRRDPTTGNLTYSQTIYDRGTTNRLNGVFHLSFSKDNRFVYASGMWDAALNIFYNPQARKTRTNNQMATTQPVPTTSPEPVQSGAAPSHTPTQSEQCNGETVTSKEFNEIRAELAAESSDLARLESAYTLLEGKMHQSSSGSRAGLSISV